MHLSFKTELQGVPKLVEAELFQAKRFKNTQKYIDEEAAAQVYN